MKHGHFSHDQGKRLQRCQKRQRSPNQALQPTALGADKIEAILEAGFSSIAFLIYSYAAAEAYADGADATTICAHPDATLARWQ